MGSMNEALRWLLFVLLIVVIVAVIALVLSLILGILFALLYLVPFGYWTERYNMLLWAGIVSIPVGILLIALLIWGDRALARRRTPHHPIGEDEV
jgi:ABC-type amino acid transport system permease subunit